MIEEVASHPMNDSTHPMNDRTHPTDDSTHPMNDGTYPTNDGTYPTNDGTYPTDDSTYPTDDSTYRINDVVHQEHGHAHEPHHVDESRLTGTASTMHNHGENNNASVSSTPLHPNIQLIGQVDPGTSPDDDHAWLAFISPDFFKNPHTTLSPLNASTNAPVQTFGGQE
jgi:hypothetical protein